MTKKYTFLFNKLVRNKAPDIMLSEGLEPTIRLLDHAEYIAELKRKIIEEAKEVSESGPEELLEEMSDVLEVLYSLAKAHNWTPEDIESERLRKFERRGGFEDKIYISSVSSSQEGGRLFNYLRSKPKEYIEV